MELSDNELFAVYRDLKSEQRSQSQIRPIDRKGGRKNINPLKNKALPHVLKILEETKGAAQRGDFSNKAELSYQTLKMISVGDNSSGSFDPVFGSNGILTQTPKQSIAMDSMLMYLNAASKALETVEIHDSSAAQTLSQVIDFLATESTHKTLSDQIQLLMLERDRLQTFNQQNEITIQKQNETIFELQEEIQIMRDRMVDNEIKVQIVEREKRELQRIIEKKCEQIKKQKEITDALAEQSHQLTDLKDDLFRSNNEKEKNIQKLFRQNDARLSEVQLLNEKLKELKHINSELLNQNQLMQQKVLEVQAEAQIVKDKAAKEASSVLLELERQQEKEKHFNEQCESYEQQIMDLKQQLFEEKHKNKYANAGGSGSLTNSLTNSQTGTPASNAMAQLAASKGRRQAQLGKNGSMANLIPGAPGYYGEIGGYSNNCGLSNEEFAGDRKRRTLADLLLDRQYSKSDSDLLNEQRFRRLEEERIARIAEERAEDIGKAVAEAENQLGAFFGSGKDEDRKQGLDGLYAHIQKIADELGISFEEALKLPQVRELLNKFGVQSSELLAIEREKNPGGGSGLHGKWSKNLGEDSSDYEEVIDENGRVVRIRKPGRGKNNIEEFGDLNDIAGRLRRGRKGKHNQTHRVNQDGVTVSEGNNKAVYVYPKVSISACQCDIGVDLQIYICEKCKALLDNVDGLEMVGRHRITVEDAEDLKDGQRLFARHLEQKAQEEEFLKKQHERLIRFKVDRFIKARTALLNNFKEQTSLQQKINQIEVFLASKPEIVNMEQKTQLEQMRGKLMELQLMNPKLEDDFLGLQEYYIDVSQTVIRRGGKSNDSIVKQCDTIERSKLEDEQPINLMEYLPTGVRLWLNDEKQQKTQKIDPDISDDDSIGEFSDNAKTKKDKIFTIKDMNRLKALIELAAMAQADVGMQVNLSKQHQEQLGIHIKSQNGIKVTQLVNKLMQRLQGKIRKATLHKGLTELKMERIEALKVAGDFQSAKQLEKELQEGNTENNEVNQFDLTSVDGSMIRRVAQRPIYTIVGEKLINPFLPAVKQRKDRLRRQARRQNQLVQDQLKELKNDLGRLSPVEKYKQGSEYAKMLQSKLLLTTLKVTNIQEVQEKKEKVEKTKKVDKQQINDVEQQIIDWYQPENVLEIHKVKESNLITLQEDEIPTEFITKKTPILKLQNKDLYQLRNEYYLDNNQLSEEEKRGKQPVGIGGEITWVLFESQFETVLTQFKPILGKEHTMDLDLDSYKYAQIPYGTMIKELQWVQHTIIIFYQFLVANDSSIDMKSKSNFNQLLAMWVKREYNNKQIMVKLMYHLLINSYFWKDSCTLVNIFKLFMYGQISYNYFFIYIDIYKFLINNLLEGSKAQVQQIINLQIGQEDAQKLSMGILSKSSQLDGQKCGIFDFLSKQIMYLRSKRKAIGNLILDQFQQLCDAHQNITKQQFITFSQKIYGNQIQYSYNSIPQKISQTQFLKNMGKFEAQASGCFDKLEDIAVALKQMICKDNEIDEMYNQAKEEINECKLMVLRKFRLVTFVYDAWGLAWRKSQ